MARIIPALAIGAAILYFGTRRASAQTVPPPSPVTSLPWESDDTGYETMPTFPGEYGAPIDEFGEIVTPEPPYIDGFSPIVMQSNATTARINALLYAIRTAEVTNVPDPERYFIGYGYRRFSDYSEHPVRTRRFPTGPGELQPVPLSAEMCRNAGLNPPCVSTAAGAYQFTRPTWEGLRAAGRYGPRLPDFSPESQDEAARRLLMEIGAIGPLNAGDIQTAVRIAGARWASLPGSTAKQGGKTMSQVLAYFTEAGGYAVA